MKLQNPEKQTELENLIAALNESNQAFYEVQDKALAMKTNIERNQKMIEALELDNQEAQKEIDSLQVSETGEINFDGFDETSERISKNNRKIETIKKVIEKFNIQLDILLITEYRDLSRKCESLSRQCFLFMGDELMNELLSSDLAEKLNVIFTALLKGGKYSFSNYSLSEDVRNVFLSGLAHQLKPRINTLSDIQPLGIQAPEIKLTVPMSDGSLVRQNQYLEELRKRLDNLN